MLQFWLLQILMNNMAKFGKLPCCNYRENKPFRCPAGAPEERRTRAKTRRKHYFYRFSEGYGAAPAKPSVAYILSLERLFLQLFGEIVNTGRGYVCMERTPLQKLLSREV